MRILLVYPPYVSPWSPYLSLPALAAFLRTRTSADVFLRDLNLDFFDYCTSPPREKEARRDEEEEKVDWRAIETAKRALRSPGAFPSTEERLRETLIAVDRAMELLSRRFSPTKLHFFPKRYHLKPIQSNLFPHGPFLGGYEMRYSPVSSQEIRAAVDDVSENPFIPFYRDRFLPIVRQLQPKLLGISVAFPQQHIPAFTLASVVRDACPEMHVSLGGAQITKLGRRLATNPSFLSYLMPLVDTLVIGDGEEPLAHLASVIRSGGEIKEIPNLIVRSRDGAIVTASEPGLPLRLIPAPDFSQLHLHRYLNSGATPSLPAQATRGCYWGKCTFCDSCNMNGPYRSRPTESLWAHVVKGFESHGISGIQFVDEALPPKIMDRLSRLISEQRLPLIWSSYARLERNLTPQLCRQIAQGGCRTLFLGLEAASERVNRLMGKGVDPSNASDVLMALRDAGVRVHLFTIVGFPTETQDEARRTLDLLMAHRDLFASYTLVPFLLEKNSRAAQLPERYGINRVTEDPHLDLMTVYSYETSEGLTMDEAASLYYGFNETLEAAGVYNPIFP